MLRKILLTGLALVYLCTTAVQTAEAQSRRERAEQAYRASRLRMQYNAPRGYAYSMYLGQPIFYGPSGVYYTDPNAGTNFYSYPGYVTPGFYSPGIALPGYVAGFLY